MSSYSKNAAEPNSGAVIVDVPAQPDHVRVARLAVAAVASAQGFDLDGLDRVRIVVDEVAVLLGMQESRHEGRLTFHVQAQPGGVHIAAASVATDQTGASQDEFALAVLEALAVNIHVGDNSLTCVVLRNEPGEP